MPSAAILNDTGLTEIEVERGDLRIKVARNGPLAAMPTVYAAPAAPSTGPSTAAVRSSEAEHEGDVVNSPMVGTVYLAAGTSARRCRQCGTKSTRWHEGQILLTIEVDEDHESNPGAAWPAASS